MNYINEEHQRNFYTLLDEDKTNIHDTERQSLFYILSGNKDLYQKRKNIYDCKKHCIIRCLNTGKTRIDLSSGAKALVILGFNLYNDMNENKYSICDVFKNLDDKNKMLALGAIKIRFM